MSLLSLSLDAVERGWVPDVITRAAIRQLCAQRLRGCDRGQKITNSGTISALVESMRSGPIAPVPEKANEQHAARVFRSSSRAASQIQLLFLADSGDLVGGGRSRITGDHL